MSPLAGRRLARRALRARLAAKGTLRARPARSTHVREVELLVLAAFRAHVKRIGAARGRRRANEAGKAKRGACGAWVMAEHVCHKLVGLAIRRSRGFCTEVGNVTVADNEVEEAVVVHVAELHGPRVTRAARKVERCAKAAGAVAQQHLAGC